MCDMIEIKVNSIFGKLLFKHKSDNNTLIKTLQEAYLRGAYLQEADLRGAYLRGADLRGADLRGANLQEANLRGANLQGAYLRGADLREAYLRGADLRGANLRGANLQEADLRGADLREANLQEADLQEAYLQEANLQGAYLRGAKNFTGEELWFKQTRCLPEGDIIGYKKCQGGVIVKLLIPKEAKRSQAFSRKCRAEYAKVLDIVGALVATSSHDRSFTYRVGETIRPTEKFDEDWQNECSTGIHFFITRVEAEKY